MGNEVMNKIEIKVDKTLNNLAGNRFGRSIYQEQIKADIDENATNVVVLPKQIEDIASSFIQGMYSELSEKYGRERALDMMVLQSENEEVAKKIEYSLRVYSY